ncbi:DUF4232 domain-containing protein [Streptomyces sp. NPDC008001]|uniref:DUF4232 domain-containing protein n=1 Tax=Streptomyces sp. NPDC008001 TaxID=3364804 RepID=UPI0036EE58CC
MRTTIRRPASRPRPFAAVALASAGIAALSLAACSNSGKGEGVRTEGAASPQTSVTAPPSAAARPSESVRTAARTKPAAKPGGPAASGPRHSQGAGSASGDPYAPENRVPCSAADTEVVATPVSRPLNHMLITVTNKGSKMCDLPGYPVVKFEGAQSVPPVIEDSKPQAVTSLPPGGKGYAGVILSAGDGSGGKGRTAHELEIGFEGSGAMARAALPAKGVYVDNALRVTYWVSDPADALN